MRRWRGLAVLGAVLLALPACSAKRGATVTTTERCEQASASQWDAEATETICVREETVASGSGRHCHGVVSCTFSLAGEIVALPFRLVGGVFEILF